MSSGSTASANRPTTVTALPTPTSFEAEDRAPAPYAPLYRLRWRRLRIALRNRRNTYAREHPFFVCKAILKSAAREADLAGGIDFLWRSAHTPLPRRVTKKHLYVLDVVFPGAGSEAAERFADGLERWIANGPSNFEIDRMDRAEERSLADLEGEHCRGLDLSSREVCLDFVSPLAFRPDDPRRPHHLDAQRLIDLCTVHLARLFPDAGLPVKVQAGAVETLPWFWEEIAGEAPIRHKSKSQPGHTHLRGRLGPLYMRGEWQRHLPLLLACTELHTGFGGGSADLRTNAPGKRESLSHGHGGYLLKTGRPCLDRLLSDPNRFQKTRGELAADSPVAEELHGHLDEGKQMAEAVHARFLAGDYEPDPLTFCNLPKKGGGTRRIGLLGASDRILQGTLQTVLAKAIDRTLEEAAVGYRAGRSVATAAAKLRQAVQDGFTHAVRCDIRDFFDSIDWEQMDRSIDAVLPEADRRLRSCLHTIYRTPEKVDHERTRQRVKGIPQGSPLSPLLANLYLNRFDAAVEAGGERMIRFGDDCIILARRKDSAERALVAVRERLAALKLELSPEKTAVQALDEGFRFLGLDFPDALDEEAMEGEPLRKTLHVQQAQAFTGLDGRAVCIRKRRELIARVPLERVGEIVFHGDGAVSHRLLQTCSQEKIPVSFCSYTGWHLCTLRPDSRLWFERLGRHQQRHNALGEAGRLAVARAVVEAKLQNYLHWIETLPGKESDACRKFLADTLRRLNGAESLDCLRGHEGAAAARIFPCLNRRLEDPAFRSQGRVPRSKPDRYNTLLDFFYSRLFTRLNVLLRDAGLNPYLGFLHSGKDNYESLVCDLQEPFRARMDRLVHKLVRKGTVRAEHFVERPDGGWQFAPDGTMGRLLEAFSREESVRLARSRATLGDTLRAQCTALRRWVDAEAVELSFYRAR